MHESSGLRTAGAAVLILLAATGCESGASSARHRSEHRVVETLRRPGVPITPPAARPVAAAPVALEELVLQPLDPFVDVDYRGLDVVDDRVIWLGGADGVVLKTLNGGDDFYRCFVPGSRELDFRDVAAFDDRTCVVMSAGPGDSSRIYRTTDGGANWTLAYENPHETGFFDGLAFFDDRHGLVYGDPVDGRFFVARTEDGGASWSPIDPAGLPEARPGEAGFAASGTGLCTVGDRHAWFCTGGAGPVRVFRSDDGGRSWEAADTPLEVQQSSAGGFSLRFFDESQGVLVGGDYLQPYGQENHCAVTVDGGRNWMKVEDEAPGGHRACVAQRPDSLELICVGRAGVDLSRDGGLRWSRRDMPGFYCVEFGGPNFAFFCGSGGRLARLVAP